MKTYVVKKGDTLYGISNQFGVSVNDIVSLNNNINPSNLQIGMFLKIPDINGTNPNNVINYKVKKGDTLYSIAKNYNSNVDAIVKLNDLKSTNLFIGQVIKIPEFITEELNLPKYKNYIVKKGDTLYKIANDNNLSVDTIIKDNALSSNVLSIGQVLKIRDNIEEIEECYGKEAPISTTYIVKANDTLYSIAKKFNKSVDEIKKKNNLTSNYLSINQVLKI